VSGGRDEREAAYFTLLRARSELAELLRYEEHLQREAQRLRRSVTEEEALRSDVPSGLRRVLRVSDSELAEVVSRRLGLISDEQARLPTRIEAAERFVVECEHHHDVLRGGPDVSR
jgi:energy-converting hydrogenase A subunit M